MVQLIAELAIADGASGSNLQIIACLGTAGENEANVWRDLLRRVKTGFVGPARMLVSMPMMIKAVVVPRDVSMRLSHKLFHLMFTYHRNEFICRLCNGNVDNMTRF